MTHHFNYTDSPLAVVGAPDSEDRHVADVSPHPLNMAVEKHVRTRYVEKVHLRSLKTPSCFG